MAEEKRFTRATWQIMEQLLDVDSLEDALSGSLEIIVKTLDSEAGAIWILDPKTDRLSPLFHIGPADISNITVENGQGIEGIVTKTGRSVIVEDAVNDPRFDGTVFDDKCLVTRTMICAPLNTLHGMIGGVQVVNKKDGALYDTEELQLCERMAALAAITIDEKGLLVDFAEKKEVLAVLKDVTKEYPSGDGVLQVLKGINLEVYKNEFVVVLGESGCGKSTMMNILGGTDALQRFYHLYDWKTGEPLRSSDDGILIQKRAAECFGLDVGSEFEIALGGTRLATVRVARIFDHYVGSPMIVSPPYYERVFGEACEPSAFFVRLNGADEAALDEQLRAVKGFLSVTSSDSGRAVFEASTSVLDSLVALFIFMAAVMAGVVLLDLTSIYVLQKKPELVIMRINGFTVKEVYHYMLRETVLTTTIGILLGLGIGSAIAYKICRLLEQPAMQIVREPSMIAWLVAVAITLFFAALVNYFALRPVRNLKLTDVN